MHVRSEVGAGSLPLLLLTLLFGAGSLAELTHWSTSFRGFSVSSSPQLGSQMLVTRFLYEFGELMFSLLAGCSLNADELCYLF